MCIMYDEQQSPTVGQDGGKTGSLTDADIASAVQRILSQLRQEGGFGVILVHVQNGQAVRFEKKTIYLLSDLLPV